jgi:two-component system, OmpR family, sensor histidine kinase VanS
MKKGIVFKLFFLTTALCTLILTSIFIGQMLFFKVFYEERKTNDIKLSMEAFENNYLRNSTDIQKIMKAKDDFYNDHNSWITVLDANGDIKGEYDFSIELKTSLTDEILVIPLYTLININDIWNNPSLFQEGTLIKISGFKRGQTVIPIELYSPDINNTIFNNEIQKKLYNDDSSKETPDDFFSESGVISKINLPKFGSVSKSISSNELFIDKIREFQAELLTNQFLLPSSKASSKFVIRDYENNGIKYKIIIQPYTSKDGTTEYLFSMTSLQPLDSAISMMQDYFVYIAIFVFILILLASFYYSRTIAKPLLKINSSTKKIANLDFTEILPIKSRDEIGAISENINVLSDTLQSYIGKLKQDIEKERQLENTRKQFISGVSHELKTPLSVIQSCIAILRDGVASHKKDYYFEAMEKEIKKMDQLLIDMLELAKLESGNYKFKMGTFYINEMIAYLCKIQTIEIERKNLQLTMNLLPVEVVANELRIEQVLTNFIMNAIRHTPDKEKILIAMTEEKERVKIAIENTGVFIPSEDLDKVWDRFFRSDPSRQRSKGGTGLGLAISKNILELHQIEYGVQNTQAGVMFYFYLKKKYQTG